MLKAVIFDMDGTLFDTETINFSATKKVFEKRNIKITYEDIRPHFGKGSPAYINFLRKKHKIKETLNELVKEKRNYYKNMVKSKIRIFPGMMNLIKELKKNKIKIGMATSSHNETVKLNFDSAKLDMRLFDCIKTRDDVKREKPDPEVFLNVAGHLKVNPNNIIVIEDSIAGVEGAKRAKMKVIAVTNTFPRSKLKKADLIVNSAEKLNLKKLINL